jgi:hypothetical protein
VRVRIIVLVGIWLLTAAACRSDAVEIAYRFEEGRTTSYRMTATARAEWDIEEPGEGSYEVGFDVEETVRSVDSDGAVVEVEMNPVPARTEERGLPSPGLERRTFSLRLDPHGQVTEVLEVGGVAARVLDQEQLAFIGTYRPPLATGEVRLRDRWTNEGEIRVGSTFRQIVTTGTLVGFRRDGERRLASIEFTGAGPLEWTTALPQGSAQLIGEATTDGSGLIDIDDGTIVEAASSTRGGFDVRLVPPGGRAPITGTLQLDLRVLVERLG